MNPEIKNIPTNKSSTPAVNQPCVMDEKTYQQYKQDSKKILVRSSVITVIIGIIWSFVIPPLSILFALFIAPVGVIGGFVYLISMSKLNSKYKIPIVYRNNTSSFSNSSCCDSFGYNSFSSDPFRDNNPTYPGTAAYHARSLRS